MSPHLTNEAPSAAIPRILIVSRRSIRKNKLINFVGEYHLDLVVKYGGCPVIVPRVESVSKCLSVFGPFHGLLLTEGEDIGPTFRPNEPLPTESTRNIHSSDSTPDPEKDRIEFELVQYCFKRSIPILAICRGCQVVNISAGGSLLSDIETVLGKTVCHVDYNNYDAHRHPLDIVPHTPLSEWFDRENVLNVNSYHHQGISRLAERFTPMAYAPDGLIEAYYDPLCYDPGQGLFVVGLQFHPERMQNVDNALRKRKPVYDYPGCVRPYKAFVHAAGVFCKKERDAAVLESGCWAKEMFYRNPPSRTPFAHVDMNDILPTPAKYNFSKTENRTSVENITAELPASELYDEQHWKHSPVDAVHSKDNVLAGNFSNVSFYSKEDLSRLIKQGASVHGTRLVYGLIHGECGINDENVIENNQMNVAGDLGEIPNWKRFETGLMQTEKALQRLRGSGHEQKAISLLEKIMEQFADSGFKLHQRRIT